MSLAPSGISRFGDLSSGHQCYYPVVLVTASPDVAVNKIFAAMEGCITKTHSCPKTPPHMDVVKKGSKKVRINKFGAAQIGSILQPGAAVMCEGSHSVYATTGW